MSIGDRIWAATPEGIASPVASPPPSGDGARIYIRGLMAREPWPYGSSYAGIRSAIAAQVAAGAQRIVLDIDSVGGEVSGVHELAEYMAAIPVEVVAEVTGSCMSAAYWLASAADEICAAPDASVGSVGVLSPIGSRLGHAVAGLSPRKGAADDAQWQDLADDLAGLMLGDIARWRGLSDAAAVSAQYGGGAKVSAPRALAMGMIDRVGLTGANETGGARMALKTQPAPVAADTAAPPAPVVADDMAPSAPMPPSIDELKAKRKELELAMAALDAQLKLLEAEPADEAPEMPAPETAQARAMAAELHQLREGLRAARLDVLVATGRLAPAERPIAAELMRGEDEGRHTLYTERYASAAPSSAVPLGRISHGQPVAVDTGEKPDLVSRAKAHLKAQGLAQTQPNMRAALLAVAGKE